MSVRYPVKVSLQSKLQQVLVVEAETHRLESLAIAAAFSFTIAFLMVKENAAAEDPHL